MKYLSSNNIVSASAIFISISTLVVLIYQTKIMRDQQRLSVMPYISLNSQNSGTPNYQIILKNDGIGPAFVESVNIVYQEKDFQMDLASFLLENVPEFDSLDNIFFSNIFVGQLIPAGLSIPVLEVDNSQSDSNKLLNLI